MARLPRYVVPGQPQHVIQRGNNRAAIFGAAKDYSAFCGYLGAGCQRYGCALHAYVLMTNHVHLLITPDGVHGIAKVMQSVGRCYVGYFNTSYERSGTLWEGRYRATLIDSDRYLFACCRYIELNPVRSAQVASAGEYRWSSYHANALGQHDPLVTPHQTYIELGTDAETRCAAYRALFDSPLRAPTVAAIRESTHHGWALGSQRFREAVSAIQKRRAYPFRKGGDRRSDAYRGSTAPPNVPINGV